MEPHNKVWNEIKRNNDGNWIGEIWIDNGECIMLFDTVVDNDRAMFSYWLNFYTDTAQKCLEEATDIDDISACYLRS